MLRRFLKMFDRNATEDTFAGHTAESIKYTTTHTSRYGVWGYGDSGYYTYSDKDIIHDTTTCKQIPAERDSEQMEISTTSITSLIDNFYDSRKNPSTFIVEVKTPKSYWQLCPEIGLFYEKPTNGEIYKSGTQILDGESECVEQMRDIVRRNAFDETPAMQWRLNETFSFFMCRDRLARKPAFEAFILLGGMEQQPSI